jgi:integrase
MHHQIETKELAKSTVANHVNFLHAIFKRGMREGIVDANPVAAADKPSGETPHRDIRFLEIEEVEALIRATTDDDLGRTDAAIFLTAAMTGLRQGELIALRWRDVDWANGLLRVRYSYSRGQLTRPKSRGSERAVPMPDRVAAALDQHFKDSWCQGDDDLVFRHPVTGNFYVASTLLIRFKEALDRAGVRRVRFHDLRHTFATRMAAVGVPLRTLQAYMGHADVQTTMIYADYAPDLTGGRNWAEKAFTPSENRALTASVDG